MGKKISQLLFGIGLEQGYILKGESKYQVENVMFTNTFSYFQQFQKQISCTEPHFNEQNQCFQNGTKYCKTGTQHLCLLFIFVTINKFL